MYWEKQHEAATIITEQCTTPDKYVLRTTVWPTMEETVGGGSPRPPHIPHASVPGKSVVYRRGYGHGLSFDSNSSIFFYDQKSFSLDTLNFEFKAEHKKTILE